MTTITLDDDDDDNNNNNNNNKVIIIIIMMMMMMIIIIIIMMMMMMMIIVIIAFLERLSISNMLNCAEQVHGQNIKHMYVRHPNSMCPNSLAQTSS